MQAESSLNDVFRFVCLRPPAVPVDPIALKATPLAAAIGQERGPDKRRAMANWGLQQGGLQTGRLQAGSVVRTPAELGLGALIEDALASLRGAEAGAATFGRGFGDISALVKGADFQLDITRLSDTLLLSMFASEGLPRQLARLEAVYRGYVLLEKLAAEPVAADLPLWAFLRRPLLLPFPNDWFAPAGAGAPIRAVGLADLLVVKRQIKRYEATEIAHIENIMDGETRKRDHRFLSRVEETLTVETEATKERSEELETTERFELNRETSRTIQEDQKFGFNLSVSASFGPTMEVESGLNVELSRSTEYSEQESSAYAQEIVSRSLERVEERVRNERISKILSETEEANHHGFINESGAHVAGIYQFVDKVYEAQVFSYGMRQMFDLMIPEPASYLWHLETAPDTGTAQESLPPQPPAFTTPPFEIRYRDEDRAHEDYYATLAARYGAAGLSLPPPATQDLTLTIKEPTAAGTAGSESDQPRTIHVLDIPLPEGYARPGPPSWRRRCPIPTPCACMSRSPTRPPTSPDRPRISAMAGSCATITWAPRST